LFYVFFFFPPSHPLTAIYSAPDSCRENA